MDSVYKNDSIGTYNFTTPGAYVIKAWSSLPNGNADGNPGNDTISKSVYVQGYASLPFNESFNGTWINYYNTHDAPSMYWVNTPNTGNSSWRRNDDGTTAAWTNATTGVYTPTGVGNAPLYSARFHSRSATAGSTGTLDAYINFTPAGTKALKFWHINTSGTDTLSVFISNDGGTTFNLIQKFATVTAWTQHFVTLGTSVAANSIVRFSVTNISTTQGTDVGIDSVQVYVLAANDAGLTAINAPTTPVVSGLNPVTVTVKNYGTANLTATNIGWSVNGSAQTPYAYTNTTGIATGNTAGPDTIGTYNFTTTGYYTIKAWTSLAGDADHTNDTVSKTVYVQAYTTLPFIEGFDSTWINKNGTLEVPTTYWNNSPVTGSNSWRRDDDTISGAWTNGHLGTYSPVGANSTVHSARFHTSGTTNTNSTGTMDLFINFTPAGYKILDFWYNNASGADSLSVYLSTDNGTTFNFVKKLLTVTGWSRNVINIGNSTSSACMLRFKAVSDRGTSDIGLDQVQVYLQPAKDMAAAAWVAPASGCGLTNSEVVKVKYKNVGASAQTSIPFKYSIDGGSTFVTETYTGSIAAGDTMTYTFTQHANFSTPKVYNCIGVVNLSGDAYLGNDTVTNVLNSINNISGNPFIDSLDAGNKHYILAYSTNSLVSLDSLVGVNSTHAFNMTGGAAGTWPSGTSASTTAQQAFSYTDHVSSIKTCTVDASAFTTKLFLHLDLRQTCSQTTGNLYSYFMVLVNSVNGTDTISDVNGTKFFNPITTSSDAFASKNFNLSSYLTIPSKSFTLTFMASCKYNDATLGGTADHVFLDNIALYVPPTINNLGPDTTICQNNSITFDAGAVNGYTYTWETIPGNTVVGTSHNYTVNSAGTYVAIVTNQLGFTASDTVTVSVNPLPVAYAGKDTTINYQTPATLQGSVTGSTGSYSYSWAPANLLVNATIQNPTTTSLTVTTVFTLTVKDLITGCSGTDQVIVNNIGGPLSVSAHAKPDTICAGESVLLTALASGGTSINYTYNWNTTPVSTNDSVNVTPTANATYIVTVTSGANTATSSIAVVVHPLPIVNLGNDTTICKNKTITLHAGTGTGYVYNWSNGTTSSTLVVDSTFANGSGIAAISVTVTNSFGCISSDAINITFVTCSGIDEFGSNASIAMYPNPTGGMTNIAINGLNSNAELTVFNLQGKAILNKTVTNNTVTTLDLTYLPKGVYIVRVNNEKVNIISKLIIQ